jgi:hypothetical protein
MRADHWHISIEDEPPEDDGPATTWRSNQYNNARLYFGDPGGDMEELRRSVVHEILHLLTRDWDEAAEALEDQLSPAAWSLASKRLDHEREQAVEAIAGAWAESLPLPVPKEKRRKAA